MRAKAMDFINKTMSPAASDAVYVLRIIIGSDRRPETKQGIEGKIVRFRLGSIGDMVRDN